MNEYQNYRKLFIVSMITYAIVIVLMIFTLLKPQPEAKYEHPLVGREATVTWGYAKANSYFSSQNTGTILSIDDGWVTLISTRDTTITIPASKVHNISTE